MSIKDALICEVGNTITPRLIEEVCANTAPTDSKTLRDEFAMAAMPALLTDVRYAEVGNEYACASEVARYSYLIADEMLKARDATLKP